MGRISLASLKCVWTAERGDTRVQNTPWKNRTSHIASFSELPGNSKWNILCNLLCEASRWWIRKCFKNKCLIRVGFKYHCWEEWWVLNTIAGRNFTKITGLYVLGQDASDYWRESPGITDYFKKLRVPHKKGTWAEMNLDVLIRSFPIAARWSYDTTRFLTGGFRYIILQTNQILSNWPENKTKVDH